MSAARTLLSPYLTWYRLLKGSWHSAAASVAVQTMVAAATALAGRELGASAFGSVGVITAYFGWFTLIGSYPCFALMPSLLADPKETTSAKRRGIGTVLLMKTAFSGSATLAAIGAMSLLMPGVWHGRLRLPALIYGFIFFQAPLRNAMDVVCQGAGWLRLWSVSSTFANALPVVLLAGFALTPYRLIPLSYMALLVAGGVISFVFSGWLLLRQVEGVRHLKPRSDLVRPFLAAGRGPWLSVLGGVLSVHGARTIIATHLPSRQLALYDVAFQILCWVTGLGLAVAVPALSQWAKLGADGDVKELRRDLRSRQTATAVSMGTVALLCILFPRPILLAIYGPQFANAAPVLQAMGVSLVFAGAGGWYWMAMYALKQPWRLAMPNILSGVILVIAAYILVPFTKLGITGAAIAYTASVVVWLVLYEWEFRRAMRLATISPAA